MVELLRSSGVDADGPDVLVEQLVVDHFSIFTLDVVVTSTILHDEHERLVFVLLEVMAVVVQDVHFVKHTVSCLDQELLSILKQVDFVDLLLLLATQLHALKERIHRWDHDGRVRG